MKAIRFIRSAPHLPVKNLQQTIDYYVNTLGFDDPWVFGNSDGGVKKDEMRILFAEDPAFAGDINTNEHRLPLLWFVDNIDEVYQEFQNKEITMAAPLKDHPYGLREFAFVDINGYYIRVAEGSEQ